MKHRNKYRDNPEWKARQREAAKRYRLRRKDDLAWHSKLNRQSREAYVRLKQKPEWYAKRLAQSTAWRHRNIESQRERGRKWRKITSGARKEKYRKQRRIALEHYGGKTPTCACCGENTYEFLTLDHIEGGGSKHRKHVHDVYKWLSKNDYPKGFQVLCFNCNCAKAFSGKCPHEIRREIANLSKSLGDIYADVR